MIRELEQITDFEVALEIIKHIEHPCGICIEGRDYNLRYFYIRLAKETIPRFKDDFAKKFLNSIVTVYE